MADVHVDANFKEGQLEHVRIGQPVELTSDLYGSSVKYHGKVVGLSGGTGSAFAAIPAQNATGNWIKVVQRVPVRIALDPRGTRGASAARRPVDGSHHRHASEPELIATSKGHADDRTRASRRHGDAPLEAAPCCGWSRIVLAIANFMVVLDITIANVSVPNIAGSLGVSLQPGHLGHHLLRGGRGDHACR